MHIDARNADHRRLYSVFVDGVDISPCCQEADDVACEAIVLVRDAHGRDVRRADGKRLTAIVRGHVVIVPMRMATGWPQMSA